MEVTINTVNENLVKLSKEIALLRKNMEDYRMTEDDWRSIEKAETEYKEGKTIKLDNLKKKLKI